MTTAIKDALAKLDVSNDAHWTADGLPRIETVKFLTGNQALTREDITKEAPGFARHNPAQPAQADQAAQSGTATEPVASAAPAPAAQAAGQEQAQDGGANGKVQSEATEDDGAIEQDTDDASLEAELLAAQNRLAQIEQALVQGARMRDEAAAEVNRLAMLADSHQPQTTGSAIRAYLASQTQELANRAAAAERLKASADAAVVKGAPIDAAFARSTGYGKGRPMFNPEK